MGCCELRTLDNYTWGLLWELNGSACAEFSVVIAAEHSVELIEVPGASRNVM